MRDTGEATAEYIVRKTFFESYQKQNIANVAFDTDTKKHELTVYVKLYNYSDLIPLKIDLKPFASKLEREDCKGFYRDDSNKGMSWFEGIPND